MIDLAAVAQDGDGALVGGQRGRHLDDAAVLLPGIGVNRLQERDLVGKGHFAQRIVRLVIGLVAARRRGGQRDVDRGALLGQDGGFGGALDRFQRQLGGVGETDGLAGDDAEAEALVGAVGGRLQPAVVEQQGFRLALLDEDLAVVGALQRFAQDAAGAVQVEIVETGITFGQGEGGGSGHGRLLGFENRSGLYLGSLMPLGHG